MRLIETDAFPFEFLSPLAERESWRKEIHRPIYHVHKWWAKRLGSVFRGILLGATLPRDGDLVRAFYRSHTTNDLTVFDPFMGSGTTIGEAHKLGFAALGRDINPVAVEAARTAFGPMDRHALESAFRELAEGVGAEIRELYRSRDARGRPCDVLYFFWVMQAPCPHCRGVVDLFPSRIIARNAYPDRKPEVQILCPSCGDIFPGLHGQDAATCRSCGSRFDPERGTTRGAKATCPHCDRTFSVLDAVGASGRRPDFRLYGKLVLTGRGDKEYLRATDEDRDAYRDCSARLQAGIASGRLSLPTLTLEHGHNTRQAIGYGFRAWRDFFNERQSLALVRLQDAIARLTDASARSALLTLFSGVLEFNNMFASYKGEGTGAVRHMFSHHILKPERTPIEANIWGTPKSSGSFSNLFRSRLLRAVDYRLAPTEVNGTGSAKGRVCAPPFSGAIAERWPEDGRYAGRGIYLSCGDSARTGLMGGSVDLIVTDPPFFDNVHYSELADFFQAWRRSTPDGPANGVTTRQPDEVQDSDARSFAAKLKAVFHECDRVLRDDGLLIFTYHHSRDEGWTALAEAVMGAGFTFINSQPVKAEMSVATPKSQAKDPIQLDIILVCRKAGVSGWRRPTIPEALESARAKLMRLESTGLKLSKNDRRIVLFGQLLSTLNSPDDIGQVASRTDSYREIVDRAQPAGQDPKQLQLFD